MMQFEAEQMLGPPGAVLPGPAQASQERTPVAGQQEQRKPCKNHRYHRWYKPQRCVVCSSPDCPRGARPDHCPWRVCRPCREDIYLCREAMILEGAVDCFYEQTATDDGLRKLILKYKTDFRGQGPDGHKGSKQNRTGSSASCDAATGSGAPLPCHPVAMEAGDASVSDFEQPTMKRMKVCLGVHEKQHSIFDWPGEAFSAIPTVCFPDFAQHYIRSPLLPVLVTHCDQLVTLCTDTRIRNYIAGFEDAGATVPMAPGGRVAAILPHCLGGSVAKALVSRFLEHPSFSGVVREVPACLEWMRQTSVILSQASMMEKSPAEGPVEGHVTYICKGTRDVVACSLASLVPVLEEILRRRRRLVPEESSGWPCLSMQELKKQIPLNLGDPMLRVADWFRVQQPAGSLLYMPTGWLVFESAMDCETVLALRQFMLVPNAPSWDMYDALVRASNPSKEALEISDSIHTLLQVQQRSSNDMHFRKGDHWLVFAQDDVGENLPVSLTVVTDVWGNGREATFLWMLDPEEGVSQVEVIRWPADKRRLLCLVLAGPE